MKLEKLVYFTLLLILFSNCKRQNTEIPVLDVTKSYPSKNIILQDIADVEYIALETKEGFFVSANLPLQFMDEEIFVTNNREEIMIFDSKTGKALNSFNRYGRGPGEYTGISSIAVDRVKNEMFTTTNALSSNIHPINVYDLQGKHLRTIEFRNIGFPQFFHSYNDEYLFMYNTNIKESSPYKLISKIDTTFTFLPITFLGRDNMSVTQEDNGGYVTYYRNGGAILKTSDGYIFSEAGLDTLFQWNNRNGALTPIMIRTPSFKSMKIPIGAFIIGQSSEYIFLNTIERKFDFETHEGFKTVKLIYDNRSGQFYEGVISNSDFVDDKEVNIPTPISAGQFVIGLQALELVELYNNGKLRGKLEEIASKLSEDDNPVLMVVTLR
jgi:hypothetical protein